MLALAFLDLDDFKVINDRHTHDVGDHILQAVARRIRTVVRPHDTVVRWGGDEFLVLLEQLDHEAAGLAVVQRILAAVAEPIRYLDQEFAVTASFGVTFCPADVAIDVDQLVHRADSAMPCTESRASGITTSQSSTPLQCEAKVASSGQRRRSCDLEARPGPARIEPATAAATEERA